MTNFFWIILLSSLWVAKTENAQPGNWFVAVALSGFVVWVAPPITGRVNIFSFLRHLLGFLLFFIWEILLSSVRIARVVLSPRAYMKPGVLAVPLDAESDFEILTLATMITMTPGTLSLELAADRKTLYVHCMFIDDVEAIRGGIKKGFESRVLKLFR